MKEMSKGDLADWVRVFRELLNKGCGIQLKDEKPKEITIEVGYPKENLRTSLNKTLNTSKPDYKKALDISHIGTWGSGFKYLDNGIFPDNLAAYESPYFTYKG